MDDNAIHEWLIKCFGPVQGELAWQQISQLPDSIREQLMSQDPSTLPNPAEVQQMMAAFTAGGLNTMGDMRQVVEDGPINVKLAKSLALQQANADGSWPSVSAQEGAKVRRAMSEANLWLDTACAFDPAPGEPKALTRAGWVEDTLDAWAKFAAPVAASMGEALSSVLSERLGGAFDGEVAGMFAGPVPIPIPDGMKDPKQLLKLLGNTSFAMQLGHAAGSLSREVHGGFDQGIALSSSPAGALVAQNVEEYARQLNADVFGVNGKDADDADASESGSGNPIGFTSAKAPSDGVPSGSTDASDDVPSNADDAQVKALFEDFARPDPIPADEVMAFLALREVAHARLYSAVPWLMPRFEALIGKYARGISIDLDAMEEQLRDAGALDPDSISGAVNLTKVGIPDTPEQKEALAALESLLAMVEGWVDCVVWRAGMAHIPHIEQLREMIRRERAVGGPAERTFESLLGLELRPKRMREAANLWEMTTTAEGVDARDAKWSHPDLLPVLAEDGAGAQGGANQAHPAGGSPAAGSAAGAASDGTDWDAELSKLLGEDGGASDASDDASGDGTDGDAPDDGAKSGN
ncbi:zinc-dependent metalloprotease [Bifidobacterium sp. CP2]|uniref:zinc-dependent metalloprotease n=1 Tax=Bifidobacterium TaxID=1678 RepID=UPI001BDC46BE|nr:MULTISPECIES: zinc-dependent metalloprotease [Bifidobacterium]MBT1180587.1 zinc-dependent metalloprotease [Bifidobacterium sp. CP2]MBW3080432.1 zinc-dependent metalloprotease [Bifidobacterium saguinibicoloris]